MPASIIHAKIKYATIIIQIYKGFDFSCRNYRNSYFARVGGITTKEMNTLELEFLFLMNFKLHVNVSVFESYCCHLEREVSIGGGYHIEKTLRCAEEIKMQQREYNQITRITM